MAGLGGAGLAGCESGEQCMAGQDGMGCLCEDRQMRKHCHLVPFCSKETSGMEDQSARGRNLHQRKKGVWPAKNNGLLGDASGRNI